MGKSVAWYRGGDKALSEQIMVQFNDAYLQQSAPDLLKVLALNMSNLIISTHTYTIGSLTTPPAQVAIAI